MRYNHGGVGSLCGCDVKGWHNAKDCKSPQAGTPITPAQTTVRIGGRRTA